MTNAKIATHQAKYTLVQFHAELGGKIIDNKKEAARLRQAMKHVEAVLQLLEPGYSLRRIAVRRKEHNRFFKRGTLYRHAIDVMRKAQEPLTCREIVERMFVAKGIHNPAFKDTRIVGGGVRSWLSNNKGKIVLSDGKMPSRWTLKG